MKKKNHWHTAGSKKRQAAYKYGYKSGLELTVANQIKEAKYPVNYETEKLEYVVPATNHKYTPDFIFQKKNGETMYVETKGRWTTIDRRKMKNILASNPGVDLRIVFQNPNQKITKGSKTTYEMYANKLGITHVAKKDIPAEWFKECLKVGEVPKPQKQFLTY
jgi:predicted nuclease of restriction endonuclease-like RecB superfamily